MAARRTGQGIETEAIEDTEDREDTEAREDTEEQLATGQEIKCSDEEAATGITNHEDLVVVHIE